MVHGDRPYKAGDPRVGVVDLDAGKVALIDTEANAHDVTLSPDGKVAWVTNSGFTHLPDARVDYLGSAPYLAIRSSFSEVISTTRPRSKWILRSNDSTLPAVPAS